MEVRVGCLYTTTIHCTMWNYEVRKTSKEFAPLAWAEGFNIGDEQRRRDLAMMSIVMRSGRKKR